MTEIQFSTWITAPPWKIHITPINETHAGLTTHLNTTGRLLREIEEKEEEHNTLLSMRN
jgi:hypothetical protein